MELIVSRWKNRRDAANCRFFPTGPRQGGRGLLGRRALHARREKWGRRGDDGHEAERFILARREVKLRGQFSCAVMLAKFAQLKRVEAKEGERGGM